MTVQLTWSPFISERFSEASCQNRQEVRPVDGRAEKHWLSKTERERVARLSSAICRDVPLFLGGQTEGCAAAGPAWCVVRVSGARSLSGPRHGPARPSIERRTGRLTHSETPPGPATNLQQTSVSHQATLSPSSPRRAAVTRSVVRRERGGRERESQE